MKHLRARSWFTVAGAAIVFAAGLAISATAVFGTSADAVPAGKPARAGLAAFGSCDRMRNYLRRHRDAITGPIAEFPLGVEDSVAAAPPAGAEAVTPASSTNLQEAGVDEPDIVKASGSTIFALGGDRLRAVGVGEGTPVVLDSIELPDGPGTSTYATDRELLIAGDRALVISRSYGAPAQARTLLTEVDISDPAALRELETLTAEGNYVSARLTQTTARVVIASTPNVPIAERGRGFLPGAVLHDRVAGESSRRKLVGCESVRRPRRFSGAEMLTVLTIDLARGVEPVDTDAVMTGGEIVYASPAGLYVATERWQGLEPVAEAASVVTTAIHRFDTADPGSTEYTGSGSVDGYMLSQWSMSEYEGVLRVATTALPPWLAGEPQRESQSFITTLVEGDRRLVEAGRLGGLGRGEQIYAVRFIDGLGYVVTFRQVDPLHVVDLTDPAEPRLAGELEIPGYSAYLHPIGPGLLLGVGQDAGSDGVLRGAQASLFDVSDPAAPVRVDHASLGRGSSTEVEYDHHAFTWAAEYGLAVLPVGSWNGGGFNGAVGVRLGAGGLELTPRTSHGSSDESAIRRALVIGGLVYTVSATAVAAHDPATLERLALTRFTGG